MLGYLQGNSMNFVCDETLPVSAAFIPFNYTVKQNQT